jgi:DNA polymerase-3 subunit delta'
VFEMGVQIHFPDLLGQERLERQLQAAVSNDRLAHAYLLVGPAGSGRSTLALNLFMALNCEQRGRELAPCRQCPSCGRAAKRQHENLIILQPDTPTAAPDQISVDSLRRALRALTFPPLNQGVRLILIRPAERLNPAGANALLKSLEEPPPGNLFMLCVPDSMSLLPTLVSRCRRLALQPLSLEVMFKALQDRGCSHIPIRIALSGGYLGPALSMEPEQIDEALAWLGQDAAAPGELTKLRALAQEINAGFVTDKKTIDRQGLVSLLSLWAQYYRDLAVAQAGRPQLILLDQAKKARPPSLNAALDNFNWIRRCQNQILAKVQPELALTVLLNRLR